MTYVLIVEDHPFVASATAREVASLLPRARTRCVDSIKAAEQAIAEGGSGPDFVLLDLLLPDVEGLSGLVRLRQAAPEAQIAIVTGEQRPGVMRDAFAQGARGYLTKSADVDSFIGGLRRFLVDGFYFPPEAAEPMSAPAVNPLTEREVAAVRALASGKLNKQLATVLGVTESTFKTYLRAIYKKLGVRTRVEAVGRARELGLLDSRRGA
jgi:DNA-binding NarL/FixJ family response regulator